MTGQNTPPDAIQNRPLPGPSDVRPIWDGEEAKLPISISGLSELGPSKWSTDRAFGPRFSPKRIVGLDASRGAAVIGMIAVHLLPAYNEYTGEPTAIWKMCAGNAAALFAVLAGISVALSTGANNPHVGIKLRRSCVSLVTRALLILAIGLALDQLDVDVYNILPYYGVMFLLAVPLTRLRIRHLLELSFLFAFIGPLVVFATNSRVDYVTILNPNFHNLFETPLDVVITLLVGGTYPAVTWMAYLCLGMAVCRMNLKWLTTQAQLTVCGAIIAAASAIFTTFALDYGGGFSKLYEQTDGYSASDILEVFDFGPDGHLSTDTAGHLPTDTAWWLAISGPHTGTTPSIMLSAGVAMVIIGVLLIISRTLSGLLFPLIAAGSMSLTLYVSHLLLFVPFLDSIYEHAVIWFFAQILSMMLFSSAWYYTVGKGPLESLVAMVCRRMGKIVVPPSPKPVDVPLRDK